MSSSCKWLLLSVTPGEELDIKRIYVASACKVTFSPWTFELEFFYVENVSLCHHLYSGASK